MQKKILAYSIALAAVFAIACIWYQSQSGSDEGGRSIALPWDSSDVDGVWNVQMVSLGTPRITGKMVLEKNLLWLNGWGYDDAGRYVLSGSGAFKALYAESPGSPNQWNAQTANILRNAALALMINGKTLNDLPSLLQDNDFRDVLLEEIDKHKDEHAEYGPLLENWSQYKKLARTEAWINWVEPILNRLSPVLGDSRIRRILVNSGGTLDLSKIIEEKKILLVKVPNGQFDKNANMIGSMVVTGIKQAALSLSKKSGRQNPVALYLDEFDNFIEKDTLEAITTETARLQIGIIGAAKTLQRLSEDFRHQIVISMGILSCFALSKKDADMLGPQMFRVDGRKIKHQTIQNFFNKVNSSPQFELISDEEKLNIDRLVGQEAQTFFCYQVGTIAGLYHMRSPKFDDVPEDRVKRTLIAKMQGASAKATDKEASKSADEA